MKAVIDKMQVNRHDCVPMRLYLQKHSAGRNWPVGPSSLNPRVEDSWKETTQGGWETKAGLPPWTRSINQSIKRSSPVHAHQAAQLTQCKMHFSRPMSFSFALL